MKTAEATVLGEALGEPPRAADGAGLPLCVDLDGTLILTDMLYECLARSLHKPSVLAECVRSMVKAGGGSAKARVKSILAERTMVDVSRLSYNEEVVEFLAEQRAAGRQVFLVTASSAVLAQRIADYLGLFVDVLASTPEDNLRGARKAQVLVERFGHEGFAYVGNDATDLHVWEVAGEAVLVDTPASVAARVRPEIISRAFLVKRTPVATLVRAVRAHQWVKNLLLFVPIVTSHALGDWSAWLGSILAFVAFSLVASGLYLVNDLLDLESDRCHPTKSSRPLASGQMALRTGLLLAPSLVLAGLMVGLVSGLAVFGLVIIYGLLSAFYSAALKRQVLVDVFTLATLYTLRLYAGGEASGYLVSQWLLAFSGFLFLSLALVKRVSELQTVSDQRVLASRGYQAEDTQFLVPMGIGSAFASGVVLALYVQSPWVLEFYSSPQLVWLIVPLFIFLQCRLWLSACRGYIHDDPIVYTAKDWVSLLVGGFVLAVLTAAHLIC